MPARCDAAVPDATQAKLPLVAISGKQIDVHALHVEREGAHSLDAMVARSWISKFLAALNPNNSRNCLRFRNFAAFS
jgi:hypothetical protein